MLHLGRRQFLLAAVAVYVAPRIVEAQRQPGRVPRVGYLTARPLDLEKPWLTAFRQGMRDLGYVEGENITLEERRAGSRNTYPHWLRNSFASKLP